MLSFKRTAAPAEAAPTTTPTSSRAAASPATASAPAMASATPTASAPDNYFKFTDKHQRFLVKEARRHASALVVDALYDAAKWQFRGELPATTALSDSAVARGDEAGRFITPAQQPLEVFELRASAVARVACVAPRLAADSQQLALRSHTLLARTRVRGSLDEFMGWMATRRRAVYQGMMHTLHDGHMQHADVFSGFDAPDDEQYALKYFVVEPTAAASAALETLRHAAAPAGSAATTATTTASGDTVGASQSKGGGALSATKRKLMFLRRKGSSDSQDLTQIQQAQSTAQPPVASSDPAEGRVHFCVGEYTTVRPGVMRADAEDGSLADQRVGIISYHSVEDPELLQLCNSVAKKTTPKNVRHCTSRTLLQYSGIVAYPVASKEEDDGADYLEVVIKVSCFDARGLSAEKRATMFNFIAGFRSLAHTMLVMRLRASPFLTATNWVANERRKCCLVCHQRFSSLRRRHHCRLCGEVTCAKCSAVHQVRLVKEAKASLRICLLCVQGVEKPKWKESAVEEEVVDKEPTLKTPRPEQNDPAQEEAAEDPNAQRETEPIHLLDFSFAKELSKPRSPTSTVTDSSSPDDRLLHGEAQSVSSSTESESRFESTIRDFHDSAFSLPTLAINAKPKGGLRAEDLMSLDESSVESDSEHEVGAFELHDDLPRSASPAVGSVLPIQTYRDPGKEEGFEPTGSSIRRISSLGDGDDDDDDEEDEDDARLQALAAYGLLETDDLIDGVMPEDLALQTIVKEAAQTVDCAIAAIGFVDTSRDMVSAAYSASPLCQVPRGVVPKQYSLTWEVMQRCHDSKNVADAMASASHVMVPDTAKDRALKRNPFVLDTPYVRFMVGIPIRAWNGVVIGAMMVADIQPRTELTADELLKLKSHAALVETWLENKRERSRLVACQPEE